MDTRFPINPALRDAFAALSDIEQAERLRELRTAVTRRKPQGELVASYRAAIMPAAGDYSVFLDGRADDQWSRETLDWLIAGYA